MFNLTEAEAGWRATIAAIDLALYSMGFIPAHQITFKPMIDAIRVAWPDPTHYVAKPPHKAEGPSFARRANYADLFPVPAIAPCICGATPRPIETASFEIPETPDTAGWPNRNAAISVLSCHNCGRECRKGVVPGTNSGDASGPVIRSIAERRAIVGWNLGGEDRSPQYVVQGIDSWREEFLPTPASAPDISPAAHSLRKWVGFLPVNVARHKCLFSRGRLVGITKMRGGWFTTDPSMVGRGNCSLCAEYYDALSLPNTCQTCPLEIVGCGCLRSAGNGNSLYDRVLHNDEPIELMVEALIEAKEYEDRQLAQNKTQPQPPVQQ